MTTLPERLQDFADDYPVTCDLDRKAVALLREAATALQSGGEVVDLHKAIGRVRARANHPGTLEHHHPSYADGMRAACNMLENMRIVKSVFAASPTHPAAALQAGEV